MRMFDVLFHRLERLRFAATNIDDVLERLELLRFAAAKVGFPSAPWRRHFSCLKKEGPGCVHFGSYRVGARARRARPPCLEALRFDARRRVALTAVFSALA